MHFPCYKWSGVVPGWVDTLTHPTATNTYTLTRLPHALYHPASIVSSFNTTQDGLPVSPFVPEIPSIHSSVNTLVHQYINTPLH